MTDKRAPLEVLEDRFRDPEVGDALLYVGDYGVACENIRRGLKMLGYNSGSGDQFDGALEDCVFSFQTDYDHAFKDGHVGPGTRGRLAEELWRKFGTAALEGLKSTGKDPGGQVFLCYAHEDAAVVNKIDQWLQDRGVRVWCDKRDIRPGEDLQSVLETLIRDADKVIVVHSKRSMGRPWTTQEVALADKIEKDDRRVLIYLLLDDSPLPLGYRDRVAVDARGKTLEDLGQELLHGIRGTREWAPVEYDKNEVVVPVQKD